MSPYFPPKSHQAHPIPPQHNHPASLTLAVTGDSMSPSRNLPLCLRCRSAIAGFLWRTASHLLKRRLRRAYRPETCDSGFASLAVIGSLWQRVAHSIRVSLRSLSSELHLSQETACLHMSGDNSIDVMRCPELFTICRETIGLMYYAASSNTRF